MPITDWLSLMPFTIPYEAAATRDEFGKVLTYAVAVDYRARVTYSHKRVTSRATGQDVISSTQAWLAGVIPTLNVDDRITLPDGSTPLIVSWDLPTDEVGNHHMKIFFS
jgi:hypothetical protein